MSFASERRCSVGLLACVGARPGPGFDRRNKACRDRIPFDVSDNAIEFVSIPDAMIVRLPLPELPPGSPKNNICLPRRRAFDPSHHLWQRTQWLKYEVDMVRHDDPGSSFIQTVEALPVLECLRHDFRNPQICEPSRPSCSLVHHPVSFGERSSALPRGYLAMRPRSVQAPGDKLNRLRRIEVWKIALVVHGGIAGQKAHATPDSGFEK